MKRATKSEVTPPAIGAQWEGGIYAGVSLHEGKPVHLVLLPEDHDGCTWKAAGTWAKKLGGELPNRHDLIVLFENVRDQLKRDWYWSGQTIAGDESYAWFQHFDYGLQGDYRKDHELRARAVRRVAI